jgi:hypothetical protein
MLTGRGVNPGLNRGSEGTTRRYSFPVAIPDRLLFPVEGLAVTFGSTP